MNERFRALYDEIVAVPQISGERLDEVARELRSMGDISADLHEGIVLQFEKRNWGNLFRLIWNIPWRSPNRIFTPVLCEILDEGLEQGIGETVVDALHDMRDPRAIPALTRAIDHYEPGDDDRHLNRKIIDALERIATPEAFDVIRTALDSDSEHIREAARAALDRREQT